MVGWGLSCMAWTKANTYSDRSHSILQEMPTVIDPILSQAILSPAVKNALLMDLGHLWVLEDTDMSTNLPLLIVIAAHD